MRLHYCNFEPWVADYNHHCATFHSLKKPFKLKHNKTFSKERGRQKITKLRSVTLICEKLMGIKMSQILLYADMKIV